ncbi:MAG: FAD-dependent oxidoreductase, partial [Gammaproteobacteria bacterium]
MATPGRSPLDAKAQALFEPEDGLYFAGDWLVSAHSDGAVVSGRRAAERIVKDLASPKWGSSSGAPSAR